MEKQQGGAFTVSGYLALFLLALCVSEAALIRHLYSHRTLSINPHFMVSPAITIRPPDEYVNHSWPRKNAASCDGFNTICWIRI